MKPIFIRPLTENEHEQLQAGLHSSVNLGITWADSDRILTIKWAVERAKDAQNCCYPSIFCEEASL